MNRILTICIFAAQAVQGLMQGRPLDQWQDYPYFAIVDGPKTWCGGAIIADAWVVTASHCLVETKLTEVSVVRRYDRCDDSPWQDKRDIVPVKQSISHPLYLANPSFENYVYDIGLVELERPVQSHRIAVAGDEHDQQDQGIPFFIGVGYSSESGDKPDHLQGIEGSLVKVPGVTDMLLMTLPDGSSLCHGDSGGPLTISQNREDRILTGVLSRIFNTRDPNSTILTCPVPDGSNRTVYNGFVDVPRHLDWIAATTGLPKTLFTAVPERSSNNAPVCSGTEALKAFDWRSVSILFPVLVAAAVIIASCMVVM